MIPDIFTPLMIIALALLCFTEHELTRPSRIILVLLLGTAVAVHQANLLVGLWTLPALGLCALLGWRPSRAFLHGLFASGVGLTLGTVALVTMNLVIGSVALSSSGSVFLLARLLEDGTALSYLEQVCPQRRFAVCACLDELRSYDFLHANSLSGYFLWGGPLDKLGGFRAEEAEATAIVLGTLSKYPITQIRSAIANGWHQLFLFTTGGALFTYSDKDSPSVAIQAVFGPVVYSSYRHSKQIRGILEFDSISRIHVTIVIASSLLLILLLVTARRIRQLRPFYATIFVATLVVANAFTLGALSGPDPRYQSRVMWLVPLLAGCFLLTPRKTYHE
jgi:hypothetical protein